MIPTTVEGEQALSVQNLINALQRGIAVGKWQPTDTFVVSRDPEGNGYLALVADDVLEGYSRARIEGAGIRHRLISATREPDAVVFMSMFEIDAEF